MTLLKSIFILLMIAIIWLSLIIVSSPMLLPVCILAIKYPYFKRWRYNMLIGQDNGINAFFFNGNPDISISSRVGWMAENGSKTARYMAVVIDFMFYISIGQENHCHVSIERDEDHTK